VAGIGLMTGGFSPEELKAAGAAVVFESLGELLDSLDETPLG
jgi:phosphoglycolate phosphatase-like HAD superfamily hydrolase